MGQYCGCRDIPLLRDYIAEHERVINLGGAAIRALDDGDDWDTAIAAWKRAHPRL